MTVHYLDNSATTPLCESAKRAINEMLDGNFANPSSLHALGAKAEEAVSAAREKVIGATGLRAKPEQLVFTSGGTEAANLAIIGAATAKSRNKGKTIIVGEAEHDCVLQSAAHLASLGFKIIKVPSKNGVFDFEFFKNALDNNVILVSAMLVNNETGAVNDIAEIARIARAASPDVLIHTDAVQGFLKIDVPLSSLGADMISVSGHKIGAPKGVGALYINERVIKTRALSPIIFGGGQERGYRSGTENTLGIAAFGAAAEEYAGKLKANLALFASLRSYLIEKLEGVEGIRINVPRSAKIAENIVNITVFGIRSETMLHHLSSRGVFVSSGSACSSNTGHVSNALRSFGLSDKEAGESIRVSFGVQNTTEDVDAFVDALKDGISTLAKER